MSTKPSISMDLWAKILNSCAFFRHQNQWWLYTDLAAVNDFVKDQKYYVFRPDFFDLDKGRFCSDRLLGPFNPVEFRNEVEFFLNSAKAEQTAFSWDPPSSHEFSSCFQHIQEKIKTKIISKAVPVTFLKGKGQMTSWSKMKFLSRLLEAPETLIPYGFWMGDEGFIGATPEILFQRQGVDLTTMALAGTQVQDFSHSQDFLTDPKERKEHDFVVEDLMNQLKSLAELIREETRILELPHLRHLLTLLRGRILNSQDKNDFELIKKLHPTAALGIFPRTAGWQWLKELPGQNTRGSFGAPFALQLPQDQSAVLVGLRRFEWFEEDIRIGAGCGLVSESIFEREWMELMRKIDSVKKLLGI